MQGVVGQRLPMRPVVDLRDPRAIDHEAAVAPAPVLAAILQVLVGGQVVPCVAQGRQGIRATTGLRGHPLRTQRGVTLLGDCLWQVVWRAVGRRQHHGSTLTPFQKATRPRIDSASGFGSG